MLKIAWRHWEAEQEADGLRVWAGRGAVRLFAAESVGETSALLLERCLPGTPLAARPELEQDEVIAGLLPRLWVELDAQLAADPSLLDSGLARAGSALHRELPATADRRVLLATDAHAGNVLESRRGSLLIDPKPHAEGDPAFDVVQHLLNCEERLRSDPTGLGKRVAGLLGLDAERLRRWLFARCVQEAPNWPPLADIARRRCARPRGLLRTGHTFPRQRSHRRIGGTRESRVPTWMAVAR